MVAGMAPVLEAGRYLFTALESWPSAEEAAQLLGVFREDEGLTAYRRLAPEAALPSRRGDGENHLAGVFGFRRCRVDRGGGHGAGGGGYTL